MHKANPIIAYNFLIINFLKRTLSKGQNYKKNSFLKQPRRGKTHAVLITPHKAKPQCGAAHKAKPQCGAAHKAKPQCGAR